jgi:hypothetical protein
VELNSPADEILACLFRYTNLDTHRDSVLNFDFLDLHDLDSPEPLEPFMPNSNGAKQRWQELYEAASAETDREKLTGLIGGVEEAIMKRLEEIAHSPNHLDERNAMVQASENLLVIKTEKLSYPPIEMK